MSDPVDFNIDNYSIKDLLTIFEIKKPMSKEAVNRIYG